MHQTLKGRPMPTSQSYNDYTKMKLKIKEADINQSMHQALTDVLCPHHNLAMTMLS